jgi:hypothetical protein
MAVTARWVVERINVVSYLCLCKLAGSVDLYLDAFLLEADKEWFCDRVGMNNSDGRRRRTAISTASSTSSRAIVGRVDYPTILLENKSITIAR